MNFRIRHYSTGRLKTELELAQARLRGYISSRDTMPKASILGSLSISYGIKYEQSLITALTEELERREFSSTIQ